MKYLQGLSGIFYASKTPASSGKRARIAPGSLILLALLVMTLSSHAAGTINLVKQANYVAAGVGMNGTAFGNGAYVAVGYYNCIVRSTNGTDWTVVQGPDTTSSLTFGGIAFGNGTFVAVDNIGGIRTSYDGLAWSTRTSGTTNNLGSISYLNGKFVVPGTQGTLLTSTNGTNWVSISTGTTANLAGRIAYNGTNYLLRGYASDSQIYSATSLSGPWTAVGNPSPGDNLNFVAWLNNKFWLFTSGTRIYTSLNGSSWTQYTTAPIASTGTQVFGGIYTNSTYIFYGYDGTSYGAIWTSANGTTFTEVTPRPNSTVVGWLDYINGMYVECSGDGVATGTNYTHFNFQAGTLAGISYGGGNYVTIGTSGSDGYIATSKDWTNWANVSPQLLKTPYAITYGSGKFVVVGDVASSGNAMVATSADGTNWTVGDSGNANALAAVATDGNGTFIAAGGNGTIMKSVNAGASWTSVASGTTYFDAVTYGNGMFVAVGDSGSVFYSTTGATWNRADYTIDSGATLYGVAYGPGGFVISGADSNYNPFFASRASLTSGSWSLSSFTATHGLYYLNLVTTNALGYVAAYNDTNYEAYVLTSTNGSTWTQLDTGDAYGIAAASYLNGAVRIVGANDYKLEAVAASSQASQAALVFTPASPQAYDTTNTLTTSGGSGTGAVSYTVLSGPGSIVNSTQLVATAGSGTITIAATKAADSAYFAISATNTVTAVPASQTITFSPIGSQAMTNTLTLSATASSSLAVSFTVASGPAVLSGNSLQFTNHGSVTVIASQGGNANWSAAVPVTNTFTVLGVFNITVLSPVGPYSGSYRAIENTLFTNAVSAAISSATTQYVAQGWNQTGAATASGTSTQAVFTVTGDTTLTWLWATNYWLAISNNDSSGLVSPSSGWVAAGSSVQATATATGNLTFALWTGDVTPSESTNDPLTVAMSGPKSLKANFAGPASISFNTLIYGTDYTDYLVTNKHTGIVSTERIYPVIGNSWQFSGTPGHYYNIQTVFRLGTGDPWQPFSAGTNLPGSPLFIWTNLNSLNTNQAQFFRTQERFN